MKMTREYFKVKHSGKEIEDRYTPCCQMDTDRDVLNKNNESDWLLIEDYVEEHLSQYSDVTYVEPICCEVCGRLVEYRSKISDKRKR